jgi:hypothetical protein
MSGEEFHVEVAACNGRPQRLVSVRRSDGVELRDTLDTNSSISRSRLIGKAAKRFAIEAAEFGWLEDEVVHLADAADERADEDVGAGIARRSTADLLVELAVSRYRIGRTEADEAFAVETDGPNVALMFRGSRDALRSSLSRAFREEHGRTPNGSALTDALTALQGEAHVAKAEAVHLRVAESDGAIIIDLGDSTGRAAVVRQAGWEVVDRSPVLFRRTAATGSLPVPVRGGSLRQLRELVNISTETWPLAIGWLIAALVPNIPHPILLLGGQQGTGKSSGARQLGGVIDPSPAQLRSQPRDVETWAISAAASWLIAVDNVSSISEWWSDSLCKAVTGDGWLRRKLYSDGDLAVLAFRRVVLLTSIDAGALKGDLGDRVVLVDLEPISETQRRTEREMESCTLSARPRIFGALLDLLSNTMAELRTTELARKPRMADFAELLAAVDRAARRADIADNSALEVYLGQRERIAATVIESDPFALAVLQFAEAQGEWRGTAGGLLAHLTPERAPQNWPKTPQGVGGRLKRLIPALEQAGITITNSREGHARTRQYVISRSSTMVESETSASSAATELPQSTNVCSRTTSDPCGQLCESGCPQRDMQYPANTTPEDNADITNKYLQEPATSQSTTTCGAEA